MDFVTSFLLHVLRFYWNQWIFNVIAEKFNFRAFYCIFVTILKHRENALVLFFFSNLVLICSITSVLDFLSL